MIEERIFNIFMYFDSGVATEYGVRHSRIKGTDDEKKAFLASHVLQDHPIAHRFQLPRRFTTDEWFAAMRQGDILSYFEEAFEEFRATEAPLFCVTPIVDGVPRVDNQIGPGPFRGDAVSEIEGRGSVPDYLVNYMDGNTFRFTELIHDDYFKAIRTLFNESLYVSSAKLLMSCVDTLAFVEYGNEQGNFSRWLDKYADLTSCGITSKELWEFRNSVLHMTNLASRKIIAGKVSPIMPYVGGPDTMRQIRDDLPKPFNLYRLISVIGNAIGKWAATYEKNSDKMLKFIERYDTTISDNRLAIFPYRGEHNTTF
jgi:hypothetical protein